MADELVDVLLSVSPISASLEGVALGCESASWGSQLEGPEEVVGLLEVRANGVDLVDQVLDGLHALLAQGLADDLVVRKWDSLLVDLAIASLEDEFPNVFPGGVTKGDVWLNSAQEVAGGLVDAHEDSVMDLSQSQQSEDPENLGVELIDTSDPDNEGEFGLGGHVDLSCEFGLSAGSDFSLVGSIVLSLILLCLLQSEGSCLLVLRSSLLSKLLECGGKLTVSLLFLSQTFRLGGHYFLSWHYHKINNRILNINIYSRKAPNKVGHLVGWAI